MAAAPQDLSIRQLQYLVAVADELGFRRAAERLHVSQPTLSAQVQQVEAVLGFSVFERGARRVLVTDAGRRVVEQARRVLLAVDDLLAEAARVRDPFTGTLRVGVIPTVAPYLLPEVTPALASTYARLRISFREEKTEPALALLRGGQLDAVILALVDETKDLEHAVVVEEAFMVALPKGHPLARKKRVALEELEDEPVLLLEEGHCMRSQALALCHRVGAKEADLRATSLATLVQMSRPARGSRSCRSWPFPSRTVAGSSRCGLLRRVRRSEPSPWSGAPRARSVRRSRRWPPRCGRCCAGRRAVHPWRDRALRRRPLPSEWLGSQ